MDVPGLVGEARVNDHNGFSCSSETFISCALAQWGNHSASGWPWMGAVKSQDGVSRWSLATSFCISPTSEAEVRGVALSVPRCLWCFGARAVFEMEECDGSLPTDNGRLANAD